MKQGPAWARTSGTVAATTGGLWWIVDNFYRVNGVGLLKRQVWPFNDLFTIVAAAAVIGAVVGLVLQRRRQAHALRIAEICLPMHLAYAPDVSIADLVGAGAFPIFKNWREGSNRMSGQRDNVPVEMFDCTTVEASGEDGSTTRRRTVVLLPAEGLPRFDLRAKEFSTKLLEMAGLRGMTFDADGVGNLVDAEAVEEFGKRYQLMTTDFSTFLKLSQAESGPDQALPEGPTQEDELAVRRVFTPRVMRAFNDHPGWSAQSQGGHLAVWKGNSIRPADERPDLLAEALAIRAALLKSVSDPGRRDIPIGAAPGTAPEQQTARLTTTALGGVIGLFIGFFAGAAGSFSVFFGHAHGLRPGLGRPGPDWSFFLPPLIFFGSLALGATLGAAIGSQLPSLPTLAPRTRPALSPEQRRRKTARDRVTGIGSVLGLFLGFMGGGFAGVLLLMNLERQGVKFEFRAALFFGPPMLGLTLGGVLGGMAFRRLYDLFWPEQSESPGAVADTTLD